MSKKSDNKEVEYISEEEDQSIDKKLKKLREKLKKCQKEKEEYLAGWQRAKADLINYKKEQEQKISDYYKFANEGLILEILPVLDSFEEALKHNKDDVGGETHQWRKGLIQIYNQLKNILKNQGLEEIKAIGEKFNPEFHEALEEVESNKPEGIIVEEIQRGYKLHGRVIRPSKVKVGK